MLFTLFMILILEFREVLNLYADSLCFCFSLIVDCWFRRTLDSFDGSKMIRVLSGLLNYCYPFVLWYFWFWGVVFF